MRWTLALVPLLMLSGCLAADAPLGGLTSAEEAADGLRKGVVFFESDYTILPNDVTALDVQVPAGARNVRVEMSVEGVSNPMDEATVTLFGCGSGKVSWDPGPNVVVGISGGGSWREADLCATASPGSQTVELDGGLTAMAGRILLRADLPPS